MCDPECDCPNCEREGRGEKEKVFTWQMFEGAREGAYDVLWETVLELMNGGLKTAVREGELRPLGYDGWEEGRKLEWKKKAIDVLWDCMIGNQRMHKVMDAAEGTIVVDGKNDEEELPALQVKVLLKYLVEVFEEEDVYKCMDEALKAAEEGMEEKAFGEPRTLTELRLLSGKSCVEWEAWMAGDKKKEKATLAGPRQSAVPEMHDEVEKQDDKLRTRRFIHLTELACFQELAQKGLMSKKKAKAAIEAMDSKGYNQEGVKQFLLFVMHQICEKAALPEKKPHQREFSRLMYKTVRRVAETCLWDELMERVQGKMIVAIKQESVRPGGFWAFEPREKDAIIALRERMFENEGMDKAMARVDEPDTFLAVARISILI